MFHASFRARFIPADLQLVEVSSPWTTHIALLSTGGSCNELPCGTRGSHAAVHTIDHLCGEHEGAQETRLEDRHCRFNLNSGRREVKVMRTALQARVLPDINTLFDTSSHPHNCDVETVSFSPEQLLGLSFGLDAYLPP